MVAAGVMRMARTEDIVRNVGSPASQQGVGRAHSTDRSRREPVEGKGPRSLDTFYVAESKEIGVSLQTPPKIRTLQRKFYTKAKDEPEFRFYALYDKIWRADILEHAWHLVRANDGACGVDGVTLEKIERGGWKTWLDELREELKEGDYSASPVRRVRIPKPGGGERPLGIPTVRDRVVQMATKVVIEPIFEADLEDNAYGYRPQRSALDAVKEVHEALQEGRTEVVDADLSSYFDTIPHDQLIKSVARRISDGSVLELIKMWLKAPVIDEDDDGIRRCEPAGAEGTPQGGVISPLLANIYMNRFLKFWRLQDLDEELDARVVNYADDFVILTHDSAEQALQITRRVMEMIGLRLNEQKTHIVDADREAFGFLGYEFGREYYRKTGHTYLAAQPSKTSIKRLKRKVSRWLSRRNPLPWEVIVTRLNQVLDGWANYFSYGTLSLAYRAVDNHVYERASALLAERHRTTSSRSKRWTAQRVFGEMGVTRVSARRYNPD